MRFEHRLDLFGEEVASGGHDHPPLPSEQDKPTGAIEKPHVADGNPVAVPQQAAIVTADVAVEQHRAAHEDRAGASGLVRVPDAQLDILERPSDDGLRQIGIAVGPGDKARLGGAVELHNACVREPRTEPYGLPPRPARAADEHETQSLDWRPLAPLRGLQHQQDLARHPDQAPRRVRR